MDVQPLWRAEDVAKYLAVQVSTVRYWASKGFIPHIRLPVAVRYEPNVIVEWTRTMAKSNGVRNSPDEIASAILSSYRTTPASSGRTKR